MHSHTDHYLYRHEDDTDICNLILLQDNRIKFSANLIKTHSGGKSSLLFSDRWK